MFHFICSQLFVKYLKAQLNARPNMNNIKTCNNDCKSLHIFMSDFESQSSALAPAAVPARPTGVKVNDRLEFILSKSHKAESSLSF